MRAWDSECPFRVITINSCETGKCRSLTDAGRIWRGKVLLENISHKEDLVTRFTCDSPCVRLDDILCDFCFDISPPGFMRAIQGGPEGGWPGSNSPVQPPAEVELPGVCSPTDAGVCCPAPMADLPLLLLLDL